MAEILKRDRVKVQIITSNYRIEGDIPTHEGYRGRLSDILNDGKIFLNLSNVTIYSIHNTEKVQSHKFICFNKSDIVYIIPLEG